MAKQSWEMDFPQSYYYKVNFILLSIIGQSPYQSATRRLISTVVISIFLLVCTICQAAKIITEGFGLRVIIDVGPPMATTLLCMISVSVFYMNIKINEHLLLRIMNDWKDIENEEERKIKHSYAHYSRQFTKYYSLYLSTGVFVISFSIFLPQILDVVIPLNQTRPRVPLFQGVFLMDEERYFYAIAFFTLFTVCAILLIIATIETMLAVFVTHVCGLFELVGYRLQNIIEIQGSRKEGEEYERALSEKMRTCIAKHREALEFASILATGYSPISGLALISCFTTFSISLVESTNSQLMKSKSIPSTIGQLAVFYVTSIMGQKLIDASSDLSGKAYSANWHNYPVALQKAFLLIIERSAKPCIITAMKVHVFCVENFSAVVQMAVSYAMVLREL